MNFPHPLPEGGGTGSGGGDAADRPRRLLRTRAPQVGYSARILYQELQASRGYTGSYETVKRCVAPLRGVQLQADWTLLGLSPRPGSKVGLIGAKRWCPFVSVPPSCMCSCSPWALAVEGFITPVPTNGSRSFSGQRPRQEVK